MFRPKCYRFDLSRFPRIYVPYACVCVIWLFTRVCFGSVGSRYLRRQLFVCRSHCLPHKVLPYMCQWPSCLVSSEKNSTKLWTEKSCSEYFKAVFAKCRFFASICLLQSLSFDFHPTNKVQWTWEQMNVCLSPKFAHLSVVWANLLCLCLTYLVE